MASALERLRAIAEKKPDSALDRLERFSKAPRTPGLDVDEILPLTTAARQFARRAGGDIGSAAFETMGGSGATTALDLLNAGFSTSAVMARRGVRGLKGTPQREVRVSEDLKRGVREGDRLGAVFREETPEFAKPGEPGFVASETLRGTGMEILGLLVEGLGLGAITRGTQLAVSPAARLAAKQGRSLKALDELTRTLEKKIPASQQSQVIGGQRVKLPETLALKAALEGGPGGIPLSNRAVRKLAKKISKTKFEGIELAKPKAGTPGLPAPKKLPVRFEGLQETGTTAPAFPLVSIAETGGKIGKTVEFDPNLHEIVSAKPGVTIPPNLRPKASAFKAGTERLKALQKKARAAKGTKGEEVVPLGTPEQSLSQELKVTIARLAPQQQAQILDIIQAPVAAKPITREVIKVIPEQVKITRKVTRPPFKTPNVKTTIPALKIEKPSDSVIVSHIGQHAALDDLRNILSALFVERPDVIFTAKELKVIQESLSNLESPEAATAELVTRRAEQFLTALAAKKNPEAVARKTIQEFFTDDPTNPVFKEIVKDFRHQTKPVIELQKTVVKPSEKVKETIQDFIYHSKLVNPKLDPTVRKFAERVNTILGSDEGIALAKELPKIVAKTKPTKAQLGQLKLMQRALKFDDQQFADVQIAGMGKTVADMNRAEVKDLIRMLRGTKVIDQPIPGQLMTTPPLTSPSPLVPEPGSADIPVIPDDVLRDMFGEAGTGFALWMKQFMSPRAVLNVDPSGNGVRLYALAQAADKEIRQLDARFTHILKETLDPMTIDEDLRIGQLLDTTVFPEADLGAATVAAIPMRVLAAVHRLRKDILEEIANLPTLAGKFVPEERRIGAYFPHVFPMKKGEVSPTIEALIPRGIPKDKFFGPITKERRANEPGYDISAKSVLRFYVRGAVEKFVLDKFTPAFKEAIGKIEVEALRKYADAYIRNFRGEPQGSDVFLRSFFKLPHVNAFMKQLGATEIADSPRPATRIANVMRALQFMAKMGVRPTSALTNATQTTTNTLAEVGVTNLRKAAALITSPEGKALVQRHVVLKDPAEKFDVDPQALRRGLRTMTETSGAMFKMTEDMNRGIAFLAGVVERHGGSPAEVIASIMADDISQLSIMRGLQVVDRTQFPLGRLGKQELLRDPVMGTMLQFQSFRLFQAEFVGRLLSDATRGKPRRLFRFLIGLLLSGTLKAGARVSVLGVLASLGGKDLNVDEQDMIDLVIGETADLASGALPVGREGIPQGPLADAVMTGLGAAASGRAPSESEAVSIATGVVDVPGRVMALDILKLIDEYSLMGRKIKDQPLDRLNSRDLKRLDGSQLKRLE